MQHRHSRLIPNSTQIPNFVIDRLMPIVSNACFVVLIFICRKTFGWGKTEDRISLTQIENGTGLSRPWVVKTLAVLCSSGLLLKTRSPKGDVYQVNLDCDLDAAAERLTEFTKSTELTSESTSPLPVNSASGAGELGLQTKPTNTKPTIKTKSATSAKNGTGQNVAHLIAREHGITDRHSILAIADQIDLEISVGRDEIAVADEVRGAIDAYKATDEFKGQYRKSWKTFFGDRDTWRKFVTKTAGQRRVVTPSQAQAIALARFQ